MRVKCIRTSGHDPTSVSILRLNPTAAPDVAFDITVGNSYVVYATVVADGGCLAYVVNGDQPYIAIPSTLFRLTDGAISRYWVLNQQYVAVGGAGRTLVSISGYPAYARNSEHYSGLVDGRPSDLLVFNKYKEAMDLEFPDPAITKMAEILEGEWLQCAVCAEGWKSDMRDGMVRCPACATMHHNPLYRGVGMRTIE